MLQLKGDVSTCTWKDLGPQTIKRHSILEWAVFILGYGESKAYGD